ncbi:ABC transporter ATP-binding protein [Oceanobacillus piezotolerans]|uniref:ABC transporter ATP-binding protein n=1 Tax=Oceanobacillus piezotolerans TaxID=2448030 RepID=A0A498D3S7_9BACI|nr:ABC transporter ATP-binding protein [Oceanobacillus piezotolerans]RLL42881.1 ABC transporter ATP-binding protein [Oceanobacillus piezotolerans]
MKIIDVKGLEKSYGNLQVLKGLDFETNAGEIIGVIGMNGAGKSTFLEILMTIKDYDRGDVTIFGHNLKGISMDQLISLRKDISVVLQPTQFYKSLKVEELLRLFKAYYQSDIEIGQIIDDFQLEQHRKSFFEKLSGGWKQKVSLAIAFLSEPKLIILDEPTTGLDPHMRNVLWSYIVDYNQKKGGTVILTTHYMDEIELYCDKVMLIDNGVNKIFEKTEDILSLGYRSINDFYLSKV